MYSRTVSPVTAHASLIPDADTAARVALAIAGVSGDPSIAVAIATFGSAREFVAAVHDHLDGPAALTPLVRDRIRTHATGRAVARALEATSRLGLGVVTPSSDQWPLQLDALRGVAPAAMWTRGDPSILTTPSVAITGTTQPTAYGNHMCIELTTGLASRGWTIAATTCTGIDRIALRSAAAVDGTSLAVASTGLDQLDAADAHELQVSEQPPGFSVTIRSRRRAKYLVAALANKTIVVEAGLSSGALRTAEAAHAMSRPVGVVPGPVDSPASAGCHVLAQKHGVELITSIRDADWLR